MKSSEAKNTSPPNSTKAAPVSPNAKPDASSLQGLHRTLTLEDLKTLKAPFPKESLGVKVQSLNKERTRAMLVLYLQHTDVQDRLEQVDPAWSLEALQEERTDDQVYVRMRMTIKGVSRENIGEGGDPKAAYSDALKRCAMLFGVGRYLYDMSTVWTDYNDQRDRFRVWTVDDYEHASRGRSQIPTPPEEKERPVAEKPGLTTGDHSASAPKKSARSRDQLNRALMGLYRPYLTRFPETRFVELLQSRYSVGETRLMSLEQIEDLIQFMEQKLESAA